MVRPRLLCAVVGVVAALGIALPTPAAARHTASEPEEYDAPLILTIDELTPGEIPDTGPIVVSGTVSNVDIQTWTSITLYPFINAGPACLDCPAPITSAADLADAADAPADALVGNRIIDASATVPDLEPGARASYTITIPRELLEVSEAGVYWFGVHALGASTTSGLDGFADGRARTFLPYVPRGVDGLRGKVDTAVVVPLRHRIRHTAAGRIARANDWRADLGANGDLGGPLGFGSAAFGRPVTWLVDPAVPDAVQRLTSGNPARDLGPRQQSTGPEETETPEETDTTEEPTTEVTADARLEQPDPMVAVGRAWLARLQTELAADEVLALPYGDLDVSAAAAADPDFLVLSRERVGDVLSDWGTATTPVVAPTSGYLNPEAFTALDDGSLLLLGEGMFADEAVYPNGAPTVASFEDHTITVTADGAAEGGPGPDASLSAVQLRQRVLSEAALRMIAPGTRSPLVVVLPRQIRPQGAEDFWSGLTVRWLNLTTVGEALDRSRQEIDPGSLSYPTEQTVAQLDLSVFTAATDLIASGGSLAKVLALSEGLDAEAQEEALAGVSANFRASPRAAREALIGSRQWMQQRLDQVLIQGPRGVTLSSEEGSFAVTVRNQLARPVTVRIMASGTSEITVDDSDPLVLGPRSRTTVLLDAHAAGGGVHNVTLAVADIDGRRLGSTDQVPIRSNQVSDVIWVIIGIGAAILFMAIVLRLVRRIRGRTPKAAP